MTGGFPSQMIYDTESVHIPWRQHVIDKGYSPYVIIFWHGLEMGNLALVKITGPTIRLQVAFHIAKSLQLIEMGSNLTITAWYQGSIPKIAAN